MASVKQWKKRLIEVRDLRQQGAGLNYDRVKLLIEVYDDQEFRADESLDDLSAADRLDQEVGDLCATFLELKAVFDVYPKREQWTGRDLKRMLAEVLEAEREARAATREPSKPRARHTAEEFRELEKERDSLREKVEQLTNENLELRDQLAISNFRISELEKNAKRELVAA